METTKERFYDAIIVGEALPGLDPCWLWAGPAMGGGYGRFKYDGRWQGAHRVSLLLHGIDPKGWLSHHICGIRGCVNPFHLLLVTKEEHREMHSWEEEDLIGWERKWDWQIGSLPTFRSVLEI